MAFSRAVIWKRHQNVYINTASVCCYYRAKKKITASQRVKQPLKMQQTSPRDQVCSAAFDFSLLVIYRNVRDFQDALC